MLSRTIRLARSQPLRRVLLAGGRASSTGSRSPSNPPGVANPPDISSPSPSPSPSRSNDPFPLPLSPELAPQFEGLPPSTSTDESSALEELMMPLRKDREGETMDTLRARLTYQTRKRGTLESDLLLSTFARENLAGMTEEQLREFDRLLDEPDWDIYYWAIEKRTPPERWAGTDLLEKLKVHARNEGRVVRRMPDLWEGRASAEGSGQQ